MGGSIPILQTGRAPIGNTFINRLDCCGGLWWLDRFGKGHRVRQTKE
jgi:hypothetical protein